MKDIQTAIESAFEQRNNLSQIANSELHHAVNETIIQLDSGSLRVAEPIDGHWVVCEWLKKAVLLSFVLRSNEVIEGGDTRYFDKVPGKFDGFTGKDFEAGGYRVVPPAMVRRGAYLGRGVVLMPSYVNIGAYVDDGTMVDTWATVGSCAQIGKNVHLSGVLAWRRTGTPAGLPNDH